MATTEAENKEKLRQITEEVWSEGNLDLVDELLADDHVFYSTITPEPARGLDEFKEVVSMTRTAFPDLEVTVEDVFAEGDKVAARGRSTGTHDGEFMEIEPTGTEVEDQWISIVRLEDGQIVEGRLQNDMFGMMQQLGVVEPPGE